MSAVQPTVAAVNSNTIVVLETGNPIAILWRDQVKAIVAVWYPGQEGATAIADISTGKVNPSGDLPITFPRSIEQLPRATVPGFGTPDKTPVTARLNEGADVGYPWYLKRGLTPHYAFGHGLSYASFGYTDPRVTGGRTVTTSVTARNMGSRDGADVPQIYLQSVNGVVKPRLLAFQRVELHPGESRRITVTIDPRLLADYDVAAKSWRVLAGRYAVAVATEAGAPCETRMMVLRERRFGRRSRRGLGRSFARARIFDQIRRLKLRVIGTG